MIFTSTVSCLVLGESLHQNLFHSFLTRWVLCVLLVFIQRWFSPWGVDTILAVPYSALGSVKWWVFTLIIHCRYGFITFATEEEAVKVYTKVGEIQMASHIICSYCVHAFSYITCGCQAFYCGTFSLYVSGSVGYIRLRKQFSRP